MKIVYWRCTETCAVWCPICGDCICPRNIWDAAEPAVIAWGPMRWKRQPVARVHHPECPLHAEASPHPKAA